MTYTARVRAVVGRRERINEICELNSFLHYFLRFAITFKICKKRLKTNYKNWYFMLKARCDL